MLYTASARELALLIYWNTLSDLLQDTVECVVETCLLHSYNADVMLLQIWIKLRFFAFGARAEVCSPGCYGLDDKDLALDVTLTHPLFLSLIHRGALSRSAAALAERRNHSHYGEVFPSYYIL